MSNKLRHTVVLAMAAALGLAVLAPDVQADPQTSKQHDRRGGSRNKQGEAEKKPALSPNATRQSPETKANPKNIKQLQALQDAYEKDDWAGVIAKAQEITALPTANAYEKSFAYYMAGNAAINQDDQDTALGYFAKVIETGGMDNDSHYSTMFNLVVIDYQEERYSQALAALERFLSETKSEKTEHLALRAGLFAALERFDEAGEAFTALVAKNPDDKRLLMNAVGSLQQGEKFAEANLLLEDAYKRGMLNEARELRALYVGYMNASRWDDAQQIIEEGLQKGILQEGPDLARDFQVLAQNAYFDEKMALAITLYSRAAPMAADGEVYLNLAKVLDMEERRAEAKAAAEKALAKGIKKPEEANIIIRRNR